MDEECGLEEFDEECGLDEGELDGLCSWRAAWRADLASATMSWYDAWMLACRASFQLEEGSGPSSGSMVSVPKMVGGCSG